VPEIRALDSDSCCDKKIGGFNLRGNELALWSDVAIQLSAAQLTVNLSVASTQELLADK